MSKTTEKETKMPSPRADMSFHPDDENISPERLEARLNGTESYFMTETVRSTREVASRTPTPSNPSEGSESLPKKSESTSAETTSSPMSDSTETDAAEKIHKMARRETQKAQSVLLMDGLMQTEEAHNRLVREQTEKLAEFKADTMNEMKELRTEVKLTMEMYAKCLSAKTDNMYNRLAECADRLETQYGVMREETAEIMKEDQIVIREIPQLTEDALTRTANETMNFVEKALEESVGRYTDEIEKSTKFLRKESEDRKKKTKFEKITDVLLRVCCPVLALGTFALACVIACIV